MLSKETKAASKAQTETKAAKEIFSMKVEFLPVPKSISGLTAAKVELNQKTENAIRSFSSYFKEFRRNYKDFESVISEAVKRGRKFDANILNDVVNLGNPQAIFDADAAIYNARLKKASDAGKDLPTPAKFWGASRLQTAVIYAAEIKEVKTAK